MSRERQEAKDTSPSGAARKERGTWHAGGGTVRHLTENCMRAGDIRARGRKGEEVTGRH